MYKHTTITPTHVPHIYAGTGEEVRNRTVCRSYTEAARLSRIMRRFVDEHFEAIPNRRHYSKSNLNERIDYHIMHIQDIEPIELSFNVSPLHTIAAITRCNKNPDTMDPNEIISVTTIEGKEIDCYINTLDGSVVVVLRNDTQQYQSVKIIRNGKELAGPYALHAIYKGDVDHEPRKASTVGQLDKIPLRPSSLNVLMF